MAESIVTRCAVCRISDDVVVNVIIAAPNDPAPDGCRLVEVMNEQACDIGWVCDGLMFIDPNPPVEEEEEVVDGY